MNINLSAKYCISLQLLLFSLVFFISSYARAFVGWENPWKLIYYDDKNDVFVDGMSYSAKGYSSSLSFVLIDRTSCDPVFIQADPVFFNIDCKTKKYSMSAKLSNELQIVSVLSNNVCDFCETERLALYKASGVKSNDLKAIETLLYPVSSEILDKVLKYTIENMSETPLPKKEFIENIAATEEDIFEVQGKRSDYDAKKSFPLSLILKSNPKYCGWRIGWVYFGPDEFMEKESSRYVRIKEFEYEKGIANFWMLNLLNDNNYALMKQKVNCVNKKIKVEDLQIKTGKFLEMHEVPAEYQRWNSPPPNSPQMFLLQELCATDVKSKDDFLKKMVAGERVWLLTIKEEKIKLHLIPKLLIE